MVAPAQSHLVLKATVAALSMISIAGCGSRSTELASAAGSLPPPPPPATQTCPDGTVVPATSDCLVPPPPPPPPAPTANGDDDYTSCEGLRQLTLSPPRPSTPLPFTIDQSFFFRPGATLGQVKGQLEEALDGAGYEERGFYCVRNGFALVTRLERINPTTKAPFPPERRWNTNALGLAPDFSLQAIIEALTRADPGTYRLLIFYVTNRQVTPTVSPPSTGFGEALIQRASEELPAELEARPYTAQHRVKVLVYEFQRRAAGTDPALIRQTAPAKTHLRAAGILQRLR